MKKLLIIFSWLIAVSSYGQHSDKVISFFGTGRGWMENDHLTGKLASADTTNPSRANSGYALFDIGMDIIPTSNIQINAILRARNEIGGFYGVGARVSIRQLYVKGIIGNKMNYKVGDLDLKQSRYTLWNYEEEGKVNEPTAFSIPRSIIHYENFYTGKNTWRMQGFASDIRFKIGKLIEDLEIAGYMTRIRQAGFTIPSGSDPEKLMGGLSVDIKQSETIRLTANYSNLFEVASTSPEQKGMQDQVSTLKGEVTLPVSSYKLTLYSEAGLSNLSYKNQPAAPVARTGNIVDGGVNFSKERISIGISYRYVSADFISPGAQTKRINYGMNPSLFPFIGNSSYNRNATLLDLSRDYRLYNRTITEVWMTYRPAYANALPYGNATPNRKGITGELNLKDKKEITQLNVSSSFLSDITGQGTSENKNYTLITAGADIYLNKLFNYTKLLKISGGWKMDNASRGGDTIVAVSYQSNLLEMGLDAEVLNKFQLLFGLKWLRAKGKEFVPVKNDYDVIFDYIRINDDLTETVLAAGFRYEFTKGIYFSMQNHYFMIDDANNGLNYNLNQVFMLFNVTF